MRCIFFAAAAIFLSFGSVSAAVKPCTELKAEIAAKLDSKGVRDYELSISVRDEKASGKIVGACEDGSKNIVYRKQKPSETSAQPATATEEKPAQQEPVPVVAVRMVSAEEEQSAQAANASILKPCTALKAEIADRLDSKGVKNYTLIVLNKREGSPGQVVGACENGSKKIIYAKTR